MEKSINILITGANGFIGKNLKYELLNRGYKNINEFNRDTENKLLEEYVLNAQFIFHLAGVNRPKDESDFVEVNYGLTEQILEILKKNSKATDILFTSSTQAENDNPYGRSKKAAEDVIFDYSSKTNAKVFVFRLSNTFGKWSKPNYNSVVATYCHNISRDMDIVVNDPTALLRLSYIDDVIDDFINAMEKRLSTTSRLMTSSIIHEITLGDLAITIKSFYESRINLKVPILTDVLIKKLYSTYLSFLPDDSFGYNLKMNIDNRGSFTEFMKFEGLGQVSVNISKPGITKGNHWHHTKNEKFLVVSGHGVIRFRKIGSTDVIEYKVGSESLKVIDIPVGYTHNIENLGQSDMVTLMWANEEFDPNKPDTYFQEV